MLMMISWRIR